jgi:hypothetical protein
VTAFRAGSRDALLLVAALAVGAAIGWIDSRPTWDDTGVTVAALVTAAALFAALSGRRPWLWAIAVGVWAPLFEMGGPAGVASFAALAFAAVGAGIGYAISQGFRDRDDRTAQPR